MIRIRELTDPNSCLNRARDDEMTFVLLGRDPAMAATINFWIEERVRLGKNKADDIQILEAQNTVAMLMNGEGNGSVPDRTCKYCGVKSGPDGVRRHVTSTSLPCPGSEPGESTVINYVGKK